VYGEIIASGTELLMGEIQDTNSSWLAARLPEFGIEVRKVTLIGDDPELYEEVLKRSWENNSYTFTTGGLGPTKDDVTREVVASVLGEKTYVDSAQLDHLKNIFIARGNEMPETNIKQAWLIPSAKAIPNRMGTAPGWWVRKDKRVIVALPGPPREIQGMWSEQVSKLLLETKEGNVIMTKTLKTIGLSEGAVDEMASPVLAIDNPYVGIYAKPDGIHIRIISRATNQNSANRMLEEVDRQLMSIFKDYVWGTDEETAEESVGRLLNDLGLTLATMESCTGGLLADSITNVSGSSKYYKGGVVSYTNDAKIASGVPTDLISKYGAISQEVAKAMAEAIRLTLNADIGVGITGVAGPNPMEGKAPGTVYIGISKQTSNESYYHRFPSSSRSLVKNRATVMALLQLRDTIHRK
jgi:nicotinamide-nucleotide amidase